VISGRRSIPSGAFEAAHGRSRRHCQCRVRSPAFAFAACPPDHPRQKPLIAAMECALNGFENPERRWRPSYWSTKPCNRHSRPHRVRSSKPRFGAVGAMSVNCARVAIRHGSSLLRLGSQTCPCYKYLCHVSCLLGFLRYIGLSKRRIASGPAIPKSGVDDSQRSAPRCLRRRILSHTKPSTAGIHVAKCLQQLCNRRRVAMRLKAFPMAPPRCGTG